MKKTILKWSCAYYISHNGMMASYESVGLCIYQAQ